MRAPVRPPRRRRGDRSARWPLRRRARARNQDRQRDEIALPEIDMQMILIAEMLDPSHAAGRALAVGFADAGVLGANADRRSTVGGTGSSGNRERGRRLMVGLPSRVAT